MYDLDDESVEYAEDVSERCVHYNMCFLVQEFITFSVLSPLHTMPFVEHFYNEMMPFMK